MSKAPKAPKAETAASPVAEVVSRKDAVAKTWTDPDVAAARSARNGVMVDGVQYRSVADAFTQLALPMGKHVPFRMALKASEDGKLMYGQHEFTLTAAVTVAAEAAEVPAA